MKTVIVEDEYIIADHLETILTKIGVKVLDIVNNLDDAEKTLAFEPDFYFLDIRLENGQSGIAFGKRLKTLKIPFIYITANNEMKVLSEAVATQPETYITKPFNERDIVAAVELLKFKKKQRPTLTVIGTKGTRDIFLDQIIYCKAEGSYTKIITEDEVITQRIILGNLEEKLDNRFLRIHRSYIVNQHKITSQKSDSVFVGKEELPVSRTYKKELQDEQ